ncbi:Nuclear transport factor 2 family protein [Sulfidibacter corallicola]|uniref:Nuclear transport factor 2 family protein n=1 Tax=Sulfidibacter corallicola TaxID=2818388 RepID=A0A8A4TWU3_SULCO|nr:nuclear transport factor 2 family protein [Sulfidibacter corallicola]QTD50985.1 nuclear transport factor 2 family protein [Sulfidibacter corallicola]
MNGPNPSDRNDLGRVARRLDQLNRAWVEGRPDEMKPILHEQMVVTGPQFQVLAQGREHCLQGYRDFCNSARVLDFEVFDRDVRAFGEAVMVTYRFVVTWSREDVRHVDRGHEAFLFVHRDDEWFAAWRNVQFLAADPE